MDLKHLSDQFGIVIVLFGILNFCMLKLVFYKSLVIKFNAVAASQLIVANKVLR